MFDLITILDEHRELMRERGYEEVGLGPVKEPEIFVQQLEERVEDPSIYKERLEEGPDERPGIYMQQLEQSFSYHIQEAKFKKAIREFDVRGIGFFNEERNVIDFSFHYELDPKRGKIELKSFTAEMDGVKKKFILEQSMYNLPPATRVLAILSEGQEIKQQNTGTLEDKRSETERAALIQEILSEHHALLVDKGYTNKEYFHYSENFLYKKLEHKLESKYASENPPPDFLIRMQGFFNDQNDEVKYNFFYSIDPTKNVLQINSMVAELNDKRICYPIKEVNDLPLANNVWKHLNNSLKDEKVEIIYPKEKVKLLLREQERFLGAFGYYKTLFDNNTNFIERELQGVLIKSLNENERQVIPINRNIHLNLNDRMACRFQYSFDPIKVQLQLDTVTIKVGIVERTYSATEIENQKLVLKGIFDELNGQNRLLNARKVSEGMSERSGMKVMMKHLQKRPS